MHAHIWPYLQCLILKRLLGDFGYLGICASIMNINTGDAVVVCMGSSLIRRGLGGGDAACMGIAG